jgi:regulator of sigma E protease
MLDAAQGFLTALLAFLFVLGLVVTIHEFGHFLAARWCGVAVDRFSIGFGRPLVSWTDRSGVEWRVGWLPLGGYVKFAGDENVASVPDADDLAQARRHIEMAEGPDAVRRYFHFKPLWQRAVVVAAGPIANFILAIVLFGLLACTLGYEVVGRGVGQVVPGSAAERAGLKVGDQIVAVGDQTVHEFRDVAMFIAYRPGQPTPITVERQGQTVTVIATPDPVVRDDPVAGHVTLGRLGIASQRPRHERASVLEAPFVGAAQTWDVLSLTVSMLGQMVTGQVSPTHISGVLGIAKASGGVARTAAEGAPDLGWAVLGGLVGLLGLAAVMSVSIGFMNLLPVPVLDGGHLLFYAYEALARRPVAAKVQAAGYRVGLALLLGLMVFATVNDLQRLRVFKILGGLFS